MIANQIAGFLGVGGAVVATDYESIATVTVGAGGSNTITFSSIPSTYSHLQVRYISRCNRVDVTDSLGVRFNSDSGSNYTRHILYGYNSTTGVFANTAETYNRAGINSAANATANVFAVGVYDILDYASTSKYKTLRILGGSEDNTATGSEIRFASGLWSSTSAITSMTFYAQTGSANFTQYTTFALYGIK